MSQDKDNKEEKDIEKTEGTEGIEKTEGTEKDAVKTDKDGNPIKPEETKGEVELSKHKQSGKHSLKYDTIFKGKKDEIPFDEFSDESTSMFVNETFEIDKSTQFHYETTNNEQYQRGKEIKEKVYNVLLKYTEINFLNNRRKPSRADFNHYFFLLKSNLENESYTNIELFNELAYYFSDNLFNMFKLLDGKWRNLIINELQEHIGKLDDKSSKKITSKNLTIGAEIEFLFIDPYTDEEKNITGVIEGYNKEKEQYTINSYENIFIVHPTKISRILNNTKFKYNLNKLNNIDFL